VYIGEISDHPLSLAKKHFAVLAGKDYSAAYLQAALSVFSLDQHV